MNTGNNPNEQLAGGVKKTQVDEKLPPHLKELYMHWILQLYDCSVQDLIQS